MAVTETTRFGFWWGAALVERVACIRRKRNDVEDHVILGITTDAGVKLEVYISPTGRSVRVFKSYGGKNGVMRELR